MNCIHFLKTGASDCIILQSGAHFAMIDAAEDTDYPPNKPLLNYPGYEEQVEEYLLKNCAGKDGIVRLDFVLGTHAHSDHIGGFDTVILNDKIIIEKAFLKPYDQSGINFFERTQWDNQEVYTQMHDALVKKGVPICEDFEGYFLMLGELKVTFFNGSPVRRRRKTGENENSVVTLVECGGCRALLAGDMNIKCGGEKKISKQVGKVELLKVGHHGYEYSSSRMWLQTLDPDIAVILNEKKNVHKTVAARLKKYTHAAVYTSVECGGIKAVFENGKINIETNIM